MAQETVQRELEPAAYVEENDQPEFRTVQLTRHGMEYELKRGRDELVSINELIDEIHQLQSEDADLDDLLHRLT